MSTTAKSMSLALIGSVLLAGTVLTVAIPAASAATATSMQDAYVSSEAARDAMVVQPQLLHDRAAAQGSALVASDVDGGTLKACRGTHLDHLKGRC